MDTRRNYDAAGAATDEVKAMTAYLRGARDNTNGGKDVPKLFGHTSEYWFFSHMNATMVAKVKKEATAKEDDGSVKKGLYAMRMKSAKVGKITMEVCAIAPLPLSVRKVCATLSASRSHGGGRTSSPSRRTASSTSRPTCPPRRIR